MNSEVIVLLSSISTGILALFGLCIKFSLLSKCSRVIICWKCVEWERDVGLEARTEARTEATQNNIMSTTPRIINSSNNFSNV